MKKLQDEKIYETDLYQPIYDYLIDQGYAVHSEVKNCDITATKGEELVIIELKRSFNVTLLIQATKRQRATDSVYIAIPKPKGRSFSKGWNDMCHLIKRLELGLIIVSFKNKQADVEIVFHPMPLQRKKSNKMRNSIIKEITSRHGDFNIAGSCRSKLMTAYRENSIHIACCFEKFGPLSPKKLKELGTGSKSPSILENNHYGWFDHIAHGLYDLRPQGREYLEKYPEIAEHYRMEIDKVLSSISDSAGLKIV